MRTLSTIVALAFLLIPACFAQKQVEAEPYLLAPYAMNKQAAVTLPDFTMLRGKVVAGDADKIVILGKDGKRIEVPTDKIHLLQVRQPRRSNKLDFVGSLIGGIGLGFAGSYAGKQAGMHIHSDGSAGRVGPITGGLSFGFLGGMLGKYVIRHAVTEQVIYTLSPDVSPSPPQQPSTQPARR
jgi:hypothetical protein